MTFDEFVLKHNHLDMRIHKEKINPMQTAFHHLIKSIYKEALEEEEIEHLITNSIKKYHVL